jgi:methylthioribose-1-phosphate isomerase
MQTASYRSVQFGSDATGPYLRLLDQTLLPTEVVYLDCRDVPTVWEAIKQLRVRGAPAIGIAAAYGVLLSRGFDQTCTTTSDCDQVLADIEYLKASRPTAVNLFWALDRMQKVVTSNSQSVDLFDICKAEANAIHQEDVAMCHAIGRYGAELIDDGFGILTHCNTGGLATSEYGTALSAIFTAHDAGKRIRVFADETRPLLQGARLTMWELQQHQVPATLICDNMAGQVMREGRIQAVIVGADRITARGDAANKIGTYSVAVLAKHHGIPFYIAAPSSTFDLAMNSGDDIPIEQRSSHEITNGFGRQTAPSNIEVYNPAFDVTPAELISAIITEKGVIRPVTCDEVARVLGKAD